MASIDFRVDSRLCITGCNDHLMSMREEPSARYLGVPYFEVMPRILFQGQDGVQLVVETGRPLTLSGYRFGCFYQSFEADVEIHPLPGANGKASGARVSIQDFKGCEKSLRLEQSQHLIDIGKMASILSHGVRNPLNAIKGAVVYLKSRYSHEGPLVEFAGIMEDEISRLDKFITGFLSTSFYDFDQASIDFNTLLKKVELFTSMQARTSEIEVVFNLGQVPPVRVNAFQMEHAILNVLNNALQALSAGSRIEVLSRTESRGGGAFAVVEVLDNGPGISGRHASPQPGPIDETARSKGKGFGLFITREILQHHGGSLEIESAPMKGTRVRLFLPADSREGC